MTHVEDSDNLRTTDQFATQFRRLLYGINQEFTIVLLDITGHLLMKDEKYLKITVTGHVSTYMPVSVTGPRMCGKARSVFSSGFVIRRQPMLTSMLVTTMSVGLNLAVVLPSSLALSALQTDLSNFN